MFGYQIRIISILEMMMIIIKYTNYHYKREDGWCRWFAAAAVMTCLFHLVLLFV